MADEAILRVILEGSGTTGRGSRESAGVGGSGSSSPPKPPNISAADVFDPFIEATKKIERQRRKEEVEAAEAILKGTPLFIPPKMETVEQEAQRVFDAAQHWARVLEAIANLRTPEMLEAEAARLAKAKDYMESLRNRTEELREREVVPFDISFEAQKQANEERNRIRVKAAKENILHGPADVVPVGGKQSKSGTADLLHQIGGTVGGIAGGATKAGGAVKSAVESFAGGGGALAMGGAIIAAAAAIGATLQALGDSFIKAEHAVGDFYATMVSASDSVEAFTMNLGKSAESFGESATDLFGPLTPVMAGAVYAVGMFSRAVGAAVSSLGKIMSEISGLAERYGTYNPEIAVAQSMADLRETLADMRRGQEAGPELVSFIKARSDLQQKYEDLKIKILTKLAPVIIGGMEKIESVIGIINTLDELSKLDWADRIKLLFGNIEQMSEAGKKILEEIQRMNQNDKEYEGVTNFLDEIMAEPLSDNLGNED